jgi:hypothetical protein
VPGGRLAQELMSICDLTVATGGGPMVKSAYSSSKPAYGVGPGNSTMVIDETADIEEGSFTNGMPMTASLGCGYWGGQYHQREHPPEAFYECHLGESPDPGGQAAGRGAVR